MTRANTLPLLVHASLNNRTPQASANGQLKLGTRLGKPNRTARPHEPHRNCFDILWHAAGVDGYICKRLPLAWLAQAH